MNPVDKLDAVALARRQWLELHLESRISLTWTDNRISMISVTRRPTTGYQLRLHHMFQVAPENVWHALAAYIQSKNRAAKDVLQHYIHQQHVLIRQVPAQRQSAPPTPTAGGLCRSRSDLSASQSPVFPQPGESGYHMDAEGRSTQANLNPFWRV